MPMIKLGQETSRGSRFGFLLLGLDFGLYQSVSIEFGLFLAGLEATVSKFGGGVDEFQRHLLQSLHVSRD